LADVIDIRRFEASAFAPVLEAESRAWNDELHWDYGPAARIVTNCLVDKRLSGYALVNEGRIEGYSFFLCEGGKGLIGDFFVPNASAPRADVLRLLDHVLETLLATPGVSRVEAQLPHADAQELEHYFSEYGFKSYLRRFMVYRLRPLAEPAAAAEFVIEPWERRHDRMAAQFIYQTYRGHVDAVINDQYASAEGAERLIDNIFDLHGCGEPVPQASLVAVHRATQKLAGLVALTAVRQTTSHIPQVAVGPQFQSRGLGTALLDLAFGEAAHRGYQEVSLTVTDLNRGAVRLYERLGFETLRTFGAFVWNRE
jgi:ribosomal protein S18 acetylase RimI-like enzyme